MGQDCVLDEIVLAPHSHFYFLDRRLFVLNNFKTEKGCLQNTISLGRFSLNK